MKIPSLGSLYSKGKERQEIRIYLVLSMLFAIILRVLIQEINSMKYMLDNKNAQTGGLQKLKHLRG